MKVNKAKKRAKGTKSAATVRQDFSPAYDLVYKVALEKFDQPSETPNPAWLSLFKREWPNALKECDLSDSHGATAKYSTFLSHVLNVYSVAPAPDAVEPNSDYDNGSSEDDDTAASDANSDDEETVPEPPSASMVHRPSSLLAVDASVRALRDVVQELVTSQTKLQQEVLRAQREAEARHQAECDQLRKGLRDANTKIEALLAEVAALRARGPTALGATVSLTAPPCPEDAANPPSAPPTPTLPSGQPAPATNTTRPHVPLAQPPSARLPTAVWSDAANTLFTPNSHQRLPAAPVPNSLLSRAKRLDSQGLHTGTDQDPRFWDNIPWEDRYFEDNVAGGIAFEGLTVCILGNTTRANVLAHLGDERTSLSHCYEHKCRKEGWRLVGLTFHTDTVAKQLLTRGKTYLPGASIVRWWIGKPRMPAILEARRARSEEFKLRRQARRPAPPPALPPSPMSISGDAHVEKAKERSPLPDSQNEH